MTSQGNSTAASPDGTWGHCPNCLALVCAQALDCPHCGAVFGAGAAWHVRELPGRVPTVTEMAALGAAARHRAQRTAATHSDHNRRAQPGPVGNLGEQLLNTSGRLVLQRTDTAAESDQDLLYGLVAALVLGVAAALLGGGFAVAIGSCVAVGLLAAAAQREAGFQRTVVMDITQADLAVHTTWPRHNKTHERRIPARALRLRLVRWDTQIEGMASTCWRVHLVLPHAADDPVDADIELAVFGAADTDAARALCHRLQAHLGLAELPLQWHRLDKTEKQ